MHCEILHSQDTYHKTASVQAVQAVAQVGGRKIFVLDLNGHFTTAVAITVQGTPMLCMINTTQVS